MFIKKPDGQAKGYQGKVHKDEGEKYGGKVSNVQASGAKGTTLNQNSKWQGKTLSKLATNLK